MIKAIFFDIDGTLVSFKTHRVPDSANRAIKELHKKGVKVFIATGRHIATIDNIGDLPVDGYVTVNGSVCLLDDKVIYEHPIPESDVSTLMDYLKTKQSFPCVFVHERDLLMNFKDDDVEEVFRSLAFSDPPVASLDEMERKKVYQILAFFREDKEQTIMELLPGCETTRWNPLFTDIIPKGGSKWTGISKMLEHFSIAPEEVMAFGDGGNDTDMLTHAGIGVAMGNASDEVKAFADYVTASVDDDGVEKALRHFGLL